MRHDKQAGTIHGYAYILAAALVWGTTGTAQALAPPGATPLAIGALRILVGGLALLALVLLTGGFRAGARWHRPRLALAGLMMAVYQIAFFSGVRLSGVAVGTLVGIGSAPIFAGLLGLAFEDERLTGRWLAATAIALLGVALLSVGGDGATSFNPLGLLAALAAGLAYAVVILTNKRLIAHHRPEEVVAATICLGALLLLPLLLLVDTAWIAAPRGLAVVLHLGLLTTALSYTLFGYGLRTVPVSTAGTLTLAEPLTATALGLLLLGERLTPLAVVGMGLLFVGLVVISKR